MNKKYSNMDTNNIRLPPCTGIIIIDNDQTILVSTKRGNQSFPKGKRHRNETVLEAAWRELKEETGLDNRHIDLIEDYYIDELSDKGNLSIRYFVGLLKTDIKINKFTFDTNELACVGWYNIIDALESNFLKKARKIILLEVWEKIENS